AGPRLDRLANAIAATRVEGAVAVTEQASRSSSAKDAVSGKLSSKPEVSASYESSTEARRQTELRYNVVREAHVVFGDLNAPLRELSQMLGDRRFVLLVDEWSDIQ